MIHRINNHIFLLRLGLLDIRLLTLAWKIKRKKMSFLTYPKFFNFAQSYQLLQERGIETIQIAEFGVGRGGSAIFLAWLAENYGGTLSLFDVFGQIPAPTVIDGKRAHQRYETILNQEKEDYYGNIPDLLSLIQQEIRSVCNLDKVEFIQGKYEITLPEIRGKKYFSLIHIDCDWYESVKSVLAYLEDNIQPGAIIQVDDYSNWQGSRMAIEEAEWLSGFKTWFADDSLVIDTGTRD